MIGTLLGLTGFYAYQVNVALGTVATESFNPETARIAIEALPEDPGLEGTPITVFDYFDEPIYDVDEEIALINAQLNDPNATLFNVAAFGEPIDNEMFESYLLVGTDASGYLADTIILALQPSGGGRPIMVSLPRDLFVWNACKQTFTRLNTGLGGCSGVASGFELLAIMVEDYTGIPVDHLARINFGGFARVVDSLGGITVCVDKPTRDLKSHLLLEEPGCQKADGETALAWVRSRHPEVQEGEEWVRSGGGDFSRQRRQQDALFQLAGKASKFSSPGSLTKTLSAVSSSVRLDSSWSFSQAVGAAWKYRGISKDSVSRFTIDVQNYRTSYGAAVLLAARPFRDQLGGVYDFG